MEKSRMKNQVIYILLFIQAFFTPTILAQESYLSADTNQKLKLFDSSEPLPIQLKFSLKTVKRNTNDTTYISSYFYYKDKTDAYDSIKINLRARGNFRRDVCYNVPLKLKLKKSLTKGTLLEGNKKLKLVMPCMSNNNSNDFIIKEFMAYKIYEIVSPNHFKTRLVNIQFIEEKNKKLKEHDLIGILVEDIENVEKRLGGKEVTRRIHPFQQDAVSSIQLSIFQFLIGNTDFSVDHLHNDKLLFMDKKFIGIPYDFDMSGLVNANYAKVSGIENLPTKITHVTQRAYKGYAREESVLQSVRQEFIAYKDSIFDAVEQLKDFFYDSDQFDKAKEYVADFFEIIEDDKSFNKYIATQSRKK